MRVLLVHNFYQQAGGEDVVLHEEARLLEDHGNQAKVFSVSNDDISGLFDAVKAGLKTSYSKTSRDRLAIEIAAFKPDIVHVHNFFPLLTPSIYDACQDAGVPVVQTLHNFRTICAGSFLLRDGKVCEKCLTASPFYGAIHGCYRGSVLASLPVAKMISNHKKWNTWNTKVDAFIALTKFAREKFIEGGLPGDRIHVKPNFTPDRLKKKNQSQSREGALFVGRLSKEKGIDILLRAWQGIDYPLRIAGDGPLRQELEKKAGKQVEFLGHLSQEAVLRELGKSSFMVMPSIWYEGFPLTLLEAFSMGTPTIASNLGAMKEMVGAVSKDLLFEPGSANALRESTKWAQDNPETMVKLGTRARQVYLKNYTPKNNYTVLSDIYRKVIP